ncbi:MAG: sulfate transporter family protein [Bauldia sp.]|uniref:sulfate transporter family protein n=1 Tax=Bauldia sp. TaxID=2575872 RepID=UPI001D553981|nr:sulfate transporter family protein [Bauldia sp.]MCB1489824.1 sulfate transporter family protein [Bauldia sp.]MCB1495133.1 sulfate transporter family protein [Bauldia sp.]
MISAAGLALSEIFSPPFRSVMWKSLGLTIAVLFIIWLLLEGLLGWLVDIRSYPWLETTISIVAGLGLFIGLGFLVAPAAALLSGMFTDEVAGLVERTHYPADPPGQDLSVAAAIGDTIAFTGIVIVVNLVALALLLVPGVNLVAFFIGNGYLLGREYFEAAARRFTGRAEARALRRENGPTVFVAGLLIALFLAVPLLNLFTPLFAAAFMVHVHKRLSGSRRMASGQPRNP